MPNTLWRFVDDNGTFVADNPHRISGLYFPLANEAGLMSSVTPNLSGDIKLGQHSFLTLPMSADDLHNSRHGRNFWVYMEGAGAWCLNSLDSDESIVEAGALWHKAIKINKKLGLRIESLNFIPAADDAVELMLVEITNISKKKLRITPTAAVPIYARSADSLRDHRHVTSLLHRIRLSKYGVIVTPSMTFDERGHRANERSYFILGCGEGGEAPLGSFPTVLEFTGEGNNLSNPDAVIKNAPISGKQGMSRQGKEAMGAVRFRAAVIPAGKTIRYIMAMGIVDKGAPEKVFLKYNSPEKIESSLRVNKKFWSDKMGVARFSTHDKNFDRWMRWVSIQPVLRKIFGCSFLPDFDYGRGGRGWRDLWQDCLTLLLINPGDARGILINNFGGVRPDGSNATIIGKRNGEFISDRNNISRVWMDHGVWPFMALNLYINQSGDKDILFEKAPYFESDKIDTVLGHVLLQHERPLTKIGGHGNFLLEGADWNDGLDMAGEKGESVAFTAAYSGNLNELAALLEKINYKKDVIAGLRQKADGLARRIRKEEWITVKSGHGFFNGYYDNLGNRVEGDSGRGVRMTLTGQVFPIMSGVATREQVKEIYRSAKRYLWDKDLNGFRLNTDFRETQPNLGRAFAFAYGEKENGAFFSHMNVMFAYALYKRGFAREGFEVLDSIYRMCLNTRLSKIYPGLPEYFNSDGRGMYHYLTGSASWLALTMLTQAFGVRGDTGDLVIDPKLTRGQFGKSGRASVDTSFSGRRIRVNYLNPDDLDYGEYKVGTIYINGSPAGVSPVKKEFFLELASRPINVMDVRLS